MEKGRQEKWTKDIPTPSQEGVDYLRHRVNASDRGKQAECHCISIGNKGLAQLVYIIMEVQRCGNC
jgi:hypothetical protein